jgi:hypothetical protein
MAELDCRHGAHILQKIGYAAVTADMFVGVDAGAVMRPAPSRDDGGFLAANNARAADGVLSEMAEMPVGEVPVDRQILRHRAEHDAIACRDAPHRDRAEQHRAFIDRSSQAARMLGKNVDSAILILVPPAAY